MCCPGQPEIRWGHFAHENIHAGGRSKEAEESQGVLAVQNDRRASVHYYKGSLCRRSGGEETQIKLGDSGEHA